MEIEEEHQPPKADKQDYAVAKYMHNHMTKRIGDLHGMEVDCFFAEDAVNCLLDSPWATGKGCLFTDRHSVVGFCHDMLCKEMFHRAVLAKRKQKPAVAAKITDGNDTPGESGTDTKKGKKKLKQKEEDESKAAEDTKSTEEKAKKVKKLKLEMCDDQYFEDGREPFVWIYEPVSWTKSMIGFGILFSAVALCCYPLWPEWMRLAVYYLSVAGAAFLGVIISLAILRYIVWGIVYAVTMGKHSFFLFPNLTEDCGFFESFLPFYEYSQPGDEDKDKKSKKNKDKDGSSEQIEDKKLTESDPASGDNVSVGAAGSQTGNAGEAEGDTGSENSQPSDFEVIQESES